MARPLGKLSKVLIAAAVLTALLAATHPVWLAALGRALVRAEAPAPADVAVVLGGDAYGRRVLGGGDLVRKGLVRKALVSGPYGYFGMYECDLAIAFAVKKGYSSEYFVPVPHRALSTAEEAGVLAAELRRRGVHRYLLVTSDYHSARAGRIFRARIPDIEMRVIAVPDEHFDPNRWWSSREGQKRFIVEFQKTVAGFFGM